MPKILFALRSERGSDGKSAFEKHIGRKPNTPKSRLVEKCISEKDPAIEIEPEDFSEEADSTIFVRDRVRGSKLESAFTKVRGQIVRQSENTVTVVPNAINKEVIYSKRDVASSSGTNSKDKKPKQKKEEKGTKTPKMSEMPNKTEKAKLKRKLIESDSEPEDIGQPSNPELYIAPIPARKQTNEESPEEIEVKEDVDCSDNPEEQNAAIEEKEEIQNFPVSGTVKWEKDRSSSRISKKPDRWGHNIMVTKIEATSSAEEESLPSVFEIQKPKTN